MKMDPDQVIFFIVEKGFLEDQARVLVQSLARSNALNGRKVIAINPRRQNKIKKSTISLFENHGIVYEEKKLNSRFIFYPLANKVFTWAYIEEVYGSSFSSFLFLDTDIIVNSNLNVLFDLPVKYQAALAPVSCKDFAWQYNEKPPDLWRLLLRHFKITEEQLWLHKTLTEDAEIYPYFNSGVFFYRNTDHYFFRRYKETFEELMNYKNIRNLTYASFYFLEQASISLYLASQIRQENICILSEKENFPLIFYPRLAEGRKETLEQASLIHYHHLLEDGEYLKASLLDPDLKRWLMTIGPLKRSAAGCTERAKRILAFQLHKLKS